MRTKHWSLVLGLSVLCLAPAAWSAPPAWPLEPPKNVTVDPSTARSMELTSRAARAALAGDGQEALRLAQKAIFADPRDPWGYYDEGDALERRHRRRRLRGRRHRRRLGARRR